MVLDSAVSMPSGSCKQDRSSSKRSISRGRRRYPAVRKQDQDIIWVTLVQNSAATIALPWLA